MASRRNRASAATMALPEQLLGAQRAESDSKMLGRVFVRTADFETLENGPRHNFVIGRRGAGKSALFLELGKEFAHRQALSRSFVPEQSNVRTCLEWFEPPSKTWGAKWLTRWC
jgi:hypothetical protein